LALGKHLTSLMASLEVSLHFFRLHHGFDRPTFSTGKGPHLLFSFYCILCFSQRDLRQVSFLPLSVGSIPVFFTCICLSARYFV
jgi:hypothetical protein